MTARGLLWVSWNEAGQVVARGEDPGWAVEDGIGLHAIATGTPLIVNDVNADRRFRPYPVPITSLLAAPLKGHSLSGGKAFGLLSVADRVDRLGFTSVDLKLAATVAGLASAALENAFLVADLQRANRDLRDASEKILHQQAAMVRAEKLSSLGRMAAGVAHELRNPLVVIIGRAQLMRRNARQGRPPTAEQLDGALASVEEQGQRANRIIQGLSTYAREGPADLRPVDLRSVVAQVLELVQPQVKMDRVEVGLDLAPELPPVRGNHDQLQQVFINLIVNAAQAMPDEGGRVTVAAREDPPGTVTATVADTGVGIPPENLPKIFDPFFTTKPEGEGTGLGLSIIQGIVEKHGGTIGVTSEVGVGTTFTLRFHALQPEGR